MISVDDGIVVYDDDDTINDTGYGHIMMVYCDDT